MFFFYVKAFVQIRQEIDILSLAREAIFVISSLNKFYGSFLFGSRISILKVFGSESGFRQEKCFVR